VRRVVESNHANCVKRATADELSLRGPHVADVQDDALDTAGSDGAPGAIRGRRVVEARDAEQRAPFRFRPRSARLGQQRLDDADRAIGIVKHERGAVRVTPKRSRTTGRPRDHELHHPHAVLKMAARGARRWL